MPSGGGAVVLDGTSATGFPVGAEPPAGMVGLEAEGVDAPPGGVGEAVGADDGPVTVMASFWLAPQCPLTVQMKYWVPALVRLTLAGEVVLGAPMVLAVPHESKFALDTSATVCDPAGKLNTALYNIFISKMNKLQCS